MLGEVLEVKKMIKTLKQAPFDDILVKYQSFFIVWNAQDKSL